MDMENPNEKINVFNELAYAYQERERYALKWKKDGGKVVGCLGNDVPEELLIAAGYLPVRVCGDPNANNNTADRYIERAFDPLVRSQFERIVNGSYSYLDHLVISNSSDVLVRIFYYLRDLSRIEPNLPIPNLYFFDFLHSRFRSSALYNRERTHDFKRAIESWDEGQINSVELAQAITICNENRQLQQEFKELRSSRTPIVSGVEALQVIGSSMFMPREEHSRLLGSFMQGVRERQPLAGVRLFVTGSQHEYSHFYQLVESCGAVIIGEDHDWGTRHSAGNIDQTSDLIDGIVERYHLRQPSTSQSTVSERIKSLVEQVKDTKAQGVVFYIINGDDAPSWDFPEQRKAIEAMGLPVLLVEDQPYRLEDTADLREKVRSFVEGIQQNNYSFQPITILGACRNDMRPERTTVGSRSPSSRGASSVKRLHSAAAANTYQREWFKNIKEKVAQGEPFAIVNADVPQEIFRAMDIPYVVNQWWAAVCSAKQMSPYYFDLLNERGYREDLCRYCSLALASAFDPEPSKGPWGGLPRPSIAVTRLTCDGQSKIFETWAREFGIPYYPLENTVPLLVPGCWWDKTRWQWEELFESHRLDLMVEEFKGLIRFLEITTGKTFSEAKFRRVMDLVNQQEEYYAKARNLIAETIPAPVGIADQVPSVMIPQWHRGTEWGVKAAQLFYEEVKDLADRGIAACENEKIRLMWLGTGLWFNLGFYQHFEKRYGATFVWSIYLALAADAYARYGGEPLRALASRFAGMEDMLHMPPWNSDWYVKEAKKNQINGVVHLVAESCTQAVQGSYFIKKALEDAGIPVLELRADTVDARAWDDQQMTELLENFLETRLKAKPSY